MIRLNWVAADDDFPPMSQCLVEPNGLIAASVGLEAPQILRAYRRGIFPWYSDGEPVLWWSPNPRMVLATDAIKISQSFAKTLRQMNRLQHWCVTSDTAFEAVIAQCAGPRRAQQGTWITSELANAYTALHQQGHAHSIEVWQSGQLIGGLYGICIGRMFYGESMFSLRPEASKIALVALVDYLVLNDCPMIDCQQNTTHLTSMGGKPMHRDQFLSLLDTHCDAQRFDWHSGPLPFPLRSQTRG